MKYTRYLLLASSLFVSSVSLADTVSYKDQVKATVNPWYVLLGTGYAWSRDAGIDNPSFPQWDSAVQGYDSDLGNSAFTSFGVGKQFWNYFNFDATYTYYANDFDYQKYQTNTDSTQIVNRTRYFELTNQSILFNLTLHSGPDLYALKLNPVSIYPFASVGIGASFNRVSDFHTVLYVQETPAPTSPNFTADTSIGTSDTTTASFAWQGSVGLSVQPTNGYMVFDIGYRYYDGGTFNGPDEIIANNPVAQGAVIPVTAWDGTLTTNQVFLNVRFLV